jgi:hypothetical protein
MTPGSGRFAYRQNDSRMTLLKTAFKTFTGVMLPLEPGCHTSRAFPARTVPFGPPYTLPQ